jgi:hypothetical protein
MNILKSPNDPKKTAAAKALIDGLVSLGRSDLAEPLVQPLAQIIRAEIQRGTYPSSHAAALVDVLARLDFTSSGIALIGALDELTIGASGRSIGTTKKWLDIIVGGLSRMHSAGHIPSDQAEYIDAVLTLSTISKVWSRMPPDDGFIKALKCIGAHSSRQPACIILDFASTYVYQLAGIEADQAIGTLYPRHYRTPVALECLKSLLCVADERFIGSWIQKADERGLNEEPIALSALAKVGTHETLPLLLVKADNRRYNWRGEAASAIGEICHRLGAAIDRTILERSRVALRRMADETLHVEDTKAAQNALARLPL